MRVVAAGLCLSLALAAAGLLFGSWWLRPGGQELVLRVAPGSSLRSVAEQLEERGGLRHAWLWRHWARLRGHAKAIKRGEYRITRDMSPRDILRLLVRGEVIQYTATIPEGVTLARAIGLLHRQTDLVRELSGADDPALLRLARPSESAEGLFFPDTYHYSLGDSDLDLLRRARRKMRELLAEAWPQRAADLPFDDPYSALILASIVEKETGLASERPIIAGVFIRRLRSGMRLQTDPSVIYGLGRAFSGDLRRSHLADPGNPYNTYRHAGLPPTPIALPGRAALQAALCPAPGEALYFVARGDGSHQFSATIEEHSAAVRQYQLRRGAGYRSSPAADGT